MMNLFSLTSHKILKKEEWSVQLSKESGYYYNYFIQTPEGDQLSVDFNSPREMVYIRLQMKNKPGKVYAIALKAGRILREREQSTRAAIDSESIITPYADYLLKLPKDILRAIQGKFSLPKIVTSDSFLNSISSLYGTSNIWNAFKNHLQSKQAKEASISSIWERFLRRIPNECFDLSLAGTVFWIGYPSYLSFTQLACFSGFFGIFSGAVDWLWRQRDPFLPKVLFFIGISAAMVYFQVQYRMWGIFL